jgi:hypothetical protein
VAAVLLGWTMPGAVRPAAAALVVRFDAFPVQGDVCVAPCAVHFDAVGDGVGQLTHDSEFPRPFHSLLFSWGFQDATGGTWPYSGRNKNTAIGAIAGHVYETPGNWDVALRVTNPDGEQRGISSTQRVHVADPDLVFAATTWCFANAGTPGGAGFEACPDPRAARHVVVPLSDPIGFETALRRCNAIDGKSRCLFRAGDHFGIDELVRLSDAPGPGLVSRFGAGPNPIVFGGRSFLIPRDGWTVAHFEVWLNDAGAGPLFLINSQVSNATVFDVKAPFLRGACFESATSDEPQHSDLIAIVGVECHVQPTTTTAGIYLRSTRTLVMGNWIDNGYQGQFNLRTVHFPYSVIQHNRFERPADKRNGIQLRAWSGGTAEAPIGPPPGKTEFVIVSDNVLHHDNAETVIRTCQSADCTETLRAPGIENVIFERNFFSFSTGSGWTAGPMARAFWLQGGDMTVRNNVLDLQGVRSGSLPSRNRLVDHTHNVTGMPQLDDDRIQVLNNTVYYDDATPNGFQICGGGAYGSGHVCKNNLIHLPSEAGPLEEVDLASGWSFGDNLFTRQNPFAAAVPQRNTQPGHFRLSSVSAGVDAGWDPRGEPVEAWVDFGAKCRPEAGIDPKTQGDWDVGAFEVGAGTRCLVTPEPGTIVLVGGGLAILARRRRTVRAVT